MWSDGQTDRQAINLHPTTFAARGTKILKIETNQYFTKNEQISSQILGIIHKHLHTLFNNDSMITVISIEMTSPQRKFT